MRRRHSLRHGGRRRAAYGCGPPSVGRVSEIRPAPRRRRARPLMPIRIGSRWAVGPNSFEGFWVVDGRPVR
jgi:hypothetical protein